MPAKLDKKEEKKLWTFEKQKQNDKIMFNDLILKLHSSIHTECDNGKGLWVQTKQKQKVVSKATKHKISRKNYMEALSFKKKKNYMEAILHNVISYYIWIILIEEGKCFKKEQWIEKKTTDRLLYFKTYVKFKMWHRFLVSRTYT